MNALTLIVLVLAFLFLLQEGLVFFATLVLVALVLALVLETMQPRAHAGGGHAHGGHGGAHHGGHAEGTGSVTFDPASKQVTVSGGPSYQQIEYNPDWKGPEGGEEKLGKRFAKFVDFWGRTLTALFSAGGGKEDGKK